jgi:hypothetical protein
MKKFTSLSLALCASTILFAQDPKQQPQITGVRVAEVLASDDFESGPAWKNWNLPEMANYVLNNALGGTQTMNWSTAWGGAAIHSGKSAIYGNNCVQLHWGGCFVLQGFEIDPAKVYQLEVMVHPIGGPDDAEESETNWNNSAAIFLMVFDQSNAWQKQGLKIRISNHQGTGSNGTILDTPSLLAFDVWEGEDGKESAHNVLQFQDHWQDFYIDAVATEEQNRQTQFWIPFKIRFKGAGTVASPFIIDFYMNDIFCGTFTTTDLVWRGDNMIALHNGASNDDMCRFDNFKLSVMEKGGETGLHKIEMDNANIFVYQNKDGGLTVKSSIFGKNVVYTLYNISGVKVSTGVLAEEIITISGNFNAGVYVMRVHDNNTKTFTTAKVIVK